MWFEIQEVNAVWYFDATGCVIRDIKNIHFNWIHFNNLKFNLDFIQFVFYKTIMIENVRIKNKLAIATVMVTDMSWALINAIHEAFKNCSIEQYLKWSYDVVTARNINFDMNSLMRVGHIFVQFIFLI